VSRGQSIGISHDDHVVCADMRCVILFAGTRWVAPEVATDSVLRRPNFTPRWPTTGLLVSRG
jgi:hypothetical protein